jgi:threonylcarbamoyladenosine tRNA methylthiotransferase MtaB
MEQVKRKISIVTVGCKVNQFESEAIGEAMRKVGWELVPFGQGVDLTIINTCVVTARAEADSRRWIRKARMTNPRGLLVVTGCYPQIDPQGVMNLNPNGVIGNQEKESIPNIVEEILRARKPVIRVGDITQPKTPPALHTIHFHRHTRAFLKIQDGCNANCSYCIIPLARGRSRSIPPSQVLSSLKSLSTAGYREAVLSGIHLGAYGLDLNHRTNLLALLQLIEEGESPPRIRLSSLEPQEVTPELIHFISLSHKVCPHLHLPLQSGADEVLSRMNRPYTGGFFYELVLRIHEEIPHAAIGADVIVSFPGEDERAFQKTYDLLNSLPISYLHIFPFSPRPMTRAAEMQQKIQQSQKRERMKILFKLSGEKRKSFYHRYINNTLSFLVEHRRERGMLRGLSRNYIFCLAEGGNELMGKEVNMIIKEVIGERGIGRLIQSH